MVLVAGKHRLEAARLLGWKTIQAYVINPSPTAERTCRLWYLSENLHRSDLTVLERQEMEAEWLDLMTQVEAEQVSVPREQKLRKRGTGQGAGGGRPKGGTSESARAVGIDRVEAIRAKKVGAASPEAKAIIKEADQAMTIFVRTPSLPPTTSVP